MEVEEHLEIRGINREELTIYFKELGGSIVSHFLEEDVIVLSAEEYWTSNLSSQETFLFMHSKVPKVTITVRAVNQDTLDLLLKRFRLKILRAGG